jgi:hypothetical protein
MDGDSSGSDRMIEEEKPTATKPAPWHPSPQFIPKLKGKKTTIRLVSGGQPITGTHHIQVTPLGRSIQQVCSDSC